MTAGTTDPPVMPPVDVLLKLEAEALMGVLDATAGGAMWKRAGDPLSSFNSPRWVLEDGEGALLTLFDSGVIDTFPLPNPLRDPAAAWEMETRERLFVDPPVENDWNWVFRTGGSDFAGHPDRKVAACLAVCHEYAEHPELGPIAKHLTPLLEKR